MAASRPNAWAAFWQTLIKFDSAKLAPALAVRNTLGVVLPLIAGTAAGWPSVGIAVGTGALNVAFSDGQEPYRQRAKRMLAASVLVGLAVFAGGISGHYIWAIVAVAAGWAFAAGMMISLSSTAGDLGVISLVTLVVYAANPQPLDRAIYSGLLAFSGGLLQTLFSLAFWPLRRYRPESRALGAMFRELAASAARTAEASQSPPASAETIAARTSLGSLTNDHSVSAERFKVLMSEAERVRLGMLVLSRLRVRIGRERVDGPEIRLMDEFNEVAGAMLGAIADSLETGATARVMPEHQARLRETTEKFRAMTDVVPPSVEAMVKDARFQMDAIGGQLRASVDLVTNVTPAGLEAFERREARRPWRLRLGGTVATLRANLNLRSTVFRHALRLTVCIGLGEAAARSFSLHRSYWVPMTIAIVLKPDFTATFSRGVLRLAGTFAGLLLATGLFHLMPGILAKAVLMTGVFMFLLRWLGPANYGVFVTAVTALVVFLISLTGVMPGDVMTARAINTVAGGLIALVAYAVWPTWERAIAPEAIAGMLDAYRLYFRAIRDSYERPESNLRSSLDSARAAARLARTNAEASVDRLLAEPGTSADLAVLHSGALASSHRFVHAVMALEAGLLSSQPVPARAAFTTFANHVELTLYYLASGLRGSAVGAESLPELREAHNVLVHSGDALTERYALVNVETDRITNSLNTLSEQILGLSGS